MTDPVHALLAAMGETWPPAARHRTGPWLMRTGAGGGSRVSAATAEAAVDPADLALLEAEVRRMGQPPLVMLRPGEDGLDRMLADAGYRVQDETLLFAGPIADIPPPPAMAAFAHWPPLAVQKTLWAEAGIGPARLAVMQRATGPKAAILGRVSDRAAGVGYVAMAGGDAFLHALAVPPAMRRQGVGRHMLAAAAAWARSEGAGRLVLAVTRANTGACALYASQGLQVVGQYHYRLK